MNDDDDGGVIVVVLSCSFLVDDIIYFSGTEDLFCFDRKKRYYDGAECQKMPSRVALDVIMNSSNE
jgi:hypothetical protein